VILGDLETLADTTVVLLLLVFVGVNVAVLVLRRETVEHDHFHAPSFLPPIGAVICVGLLIQKLFDDTIVFAYAGGLLAIGALLWAVNHTATRA
jgi:amino acid transporter